MTLTEQWKKGELEAGFYYIKGADGLFGIMSDYGLYRVNLEHSDNTISLLAKVPSYEEWQQLHKFLEEFNALDVAKENQQLKELLLECGEFLYEILAGTRFKLSFKLESGIRKQYYMISLSELKTKIDNAIGEKNDSF